MKNRDTRREGRRARNLRGYAACLLPFAAALTIIPLFFFQWLTRDWGVRATHPYGVLQIRHRLDQEKTSRARLGRKVEAGNSNAAPADQQGEERPNPVADNWESAVSASGFITWRFLTGLILVVMFCAFLAAGYIIWHAPRGISEGRRLLIVSGVLLACAAFFLVLTFTGMTQNATVVVRQFLGNIEGHLNLPGGVGLVKYEYDLLLLGYVMVLYLLCASSSTLAPFCPRHPEDAPRSKVEAEWNAEFLAARMKYLRLILYVGALALAVTLLRTNLTFKWSLDYLPPLEVFGDKSPEQLAARLIYERLAAVATNTLNGNAIMNTLILAALYVPSALVLQGRADALSRQAVSLAEAEPAAEKRAEGDGGAAGGAAKKDGAEASETEGKPKAGAAPKPPDREEWLKARGLTFPFKEHLKQVAAVLSPMLAGPVSELLVFIRN